MSKIRVNRVAEQIKKEVSQIIQKELKNPNLGFVTVTDVEVTGDLQQATIYVSILGTDREKAESLAALEKSKGYLRREIGQRIRLRKTPELSLAVDGSIEYGSKIEQLLTEISKEDAAKKSGESETVQTSHAEQEGQADEE